MRRAFLRNLTAGGIGALALAAASAAPAAHPIDVPLRGFDGQFLTAASTEPYSPKETCGGCHEYATVTKGYHFQQGWDELYTAAQKAEKPWVHGPGMAGKW